MSTLTAENNSPAPQPPSVLIIASHDDQNLDACLRSVRFSDDIVVLDSGSNARTAEIALAHANVRVVQRQFDDAHAQRNHALHDIEYVHPWVYICEADEVVGDDLAAEMTRVASDANQRHAAYAVRYKVMFADKWIKRAAGYPSWQTRLVQPDLVRYERGASDQPIVTGSVGRLQGHFIYRGFNMGLRRWFDAQNHFSDCDALDGTNTRRGMLPRLAELREADPIGRQRALSSRRFILAGGSLWVFLHTYFLRGGILDGLAGLHYCAMIAMLEYWAELKVNEQRAGWIQATDDLAQKMLSEARP